MSLVITNSLVKGSAVMTATKEILLGNVMYNSTMTMFPGGGGGVIDPTKIQFFLGLEEAMTAYSCSLSFLLKGPGPGGAVKFRGTLSGSSLTPLSEDMQTEQVSTYGLWAGTACVTEILSAEGIAVLAGEFGDVSDAGDYTLTIKCDGSPAPIYIGFPNTTVYDNAGEPVTKITFSGFSHGEATIKFTKT